MTIETNIDKDGQKTTVHDFRPKLRPYAIRTGSTYEDIIWKRNLDEAKEYARQWSAEINKDVPYDHVCYVLPINVESDGSLGAERNGYKVDVKME